MAWAYSGAWTARRAEELIPIIVSLFNAIGERYEVCGLNRPSWKTNSGLKSTTLASADFEGYPLHLIDSYGTAASRVITLINGYSNANRKDLHGFSETSTYSGDPRDNLWTEASIATDVGMGDVDGITGVIGSIFDETYAVRLREVLDRMLYPVFDVVGGTTGGARNDDSITGEASPSDA